MNCNLYMTALPRKTKLVLGKLKMGWSNTLGEGPHDIPHIFICPAKSSSALCPMNLWKQSSRSVWIWLSYIKPTGPRFRRFWILRSNTGIRKTETVFYRNGILSLSLYKRPTLDIVKFYEEPLIFLRVKVKRVQSGQSRLWKMFNSLYFLYLNRF